MAQQIAPTLNSNLFWVSFVGIIYRAQLNVPEKLQNDSECKRALKDAVKKSLPSEQIFCIHNETVYSPRRLQLGAVLHVLTVPVHIIVQEEVLEREERLELMRYLLFKCLRHNTHYYHTYGKQFASPLATLTQQGRNNSQAQQAMPPATLTVWPAFTYDIVAIRDKTYLAADPVPHAFTVKSVWQILNELRDSGCAEVEQKRLLRTRIVKTIYYTKKCNYWRVIDIVGVHSDERWGTLLAQAATEAAEQHQMRVPDGSVEGESDQRQQPVLIVCPADADNGNVTQGVLLPTFCKLLCRDLSDLDALRHFRQVHEEAALSIDALTLAHEVRRFSTTFLANPQQRQFLDTWKLQFQAHSERLEFKQFDPCRLVLRSADDNAEIEVSMRTSVLNQNCNQFESLLSELMSGKYYNFPRLQKWLCVAHRESAAEVNQFLSTLDQLSQGEGYEIHPAEQLLMPSLSVNEWLLRLSERRDAATAQGTQLLLIILPPELDQPTFYRRVKQLFTATQVPVQMVRSERLHESMQFFIKRTFAQVAAKLGGYPWFVLDMPFSQRPSAVLGVYVEDAVNTLRIGVVCSVNKQYTRYIDEFVLLPNKLLLSNQNLPPGGGSTQLTTAAANAIAEAVVQRCLYRFVHEHNKYLVGGEKIKLGTVVVYREGLGTDDERHMALEARALGTAAETFNVAEAQAVKIIYIPAKVSSVRVFQQDSDQYLDERTVRAAVTGTIVQASPSTFYHVFRKSANAPTIQYTTIATGEQGDVQPQVERELQRLTHLLCFLNFSYSFDTAYPAPLQYAYKLVRFKELLLEDDGEEFLWKGQDAVAATMLYYI